MTKVNADVLRVVQDALDKYESDVSATPLRPSTKKTYILHAQHFVRWLSDDFEPGVTLK